jgi:Fe-S-cluster-containing hydrogenase component 2
VVIRDWCIGCGLCANQCPYDSIQMHDAAVIRSGAPGWYWTADDDSADDTSWRRQSFRETKWHIGATPFDWGIAMRLAVNGASVKRVRFRHRFEVAASSRPSQAAYQLTVTSPGTGLEVYLNGSRLDLTQDPPQKKRSEYAADIAGSSLRRGDNVVAIAVAPAAEFNALLLDARLDRLAEESEEFEEKLVTERAVVCDQCSSLSGNRAACVYACPHDAAFRVDTWADFPEA